MADENPEQRQRKPMSFDAYRLMVVWLFLATLIIGLATYYSVYRYEQGKQGPTILTAVMLAGVLGSFVSALNRIYSFRDIFPHQRYQDMLKEANVYLVVYSVIPPMVGAIAAVALYLVFAGGLINGSFFPTFNCGLGEGKCNTFAAFVSHWKPAQSVDFAKAIVWGFLAGFSERLVPDILNKITNAARDDASGSGH